MKIQIHFIGIEDALTVGPNANEFDDMGLDDLDLGEDNETPIETEEDAAPENANEFDDFDFDEEDPEDILRSRINEVTELGEEQEVAVQASGGLDDNVEMATESGDVSSTLETLEQIRESQRRQQEAEDQYEGEAGQIAADNQIRSDIQEVDLEIRTIAAESAFPQPDPGMPQQERTEIIRRQNELKRDLENLPDGGVVAFHQQYVEILGIDDPDERNARLVALRDDLRVSLNSLHGDQEYYNDADVDFVFQSLTSPEQMQNFAFLLFQERLLAARRIDRELGTNIAGAIAQKINSGDPPDVVLHDIDQMLNDVAAIAGDPELMSELAALQGTFNNLNRFRRMTQAAQQNYEAAQTEAKVDSGISLMSIGESLFGISVILGVQGDGELEEFTEEDQRRLEGYAELGHAGIVEGMLANPEKLRRVDGGYVGEIAGETVFLVSNNGRIEAYLEHEGQQFYIANTQPPAQGWDLARSAKEASVLNYPTIERSTLLRHALMDNPDDGTFMDSEEAAEFNGLLFKLIGKTEDVPARLQELRITDANGTFDFRYVVGLKIELKKRAAEAGVAMKELSLEPGELKALVDKWHEEDSIPTEL